MRHMKIIEDIRRGRLRELIDRYGTLASLNRALDRDARDATLSQILHGAPDSKTGKPRVLGSILARQIESQLHLPVGWMDSDPEAWPFPHIQRERFETLHGHQQIEIQGQVRTMIVRFENENQPKVTEFEPLQAVQKRRHGKKEPSHSGKSA